MDNFEYLLSWFGSPSALLSLPGPHVYYAVRAMGPVLLLLAWAYASRVRAQAGGWSALAERYSGTGQGHSRFSHNTTIYLGGVKYWRTVSMSAGRSGLSVAVAWPLRMFHPTLHVPWQDITDGGKTDYNGVEYRKLLLSPTVKIPLLVDGPVYDYLAKSYAEDAGQ